MLGAVVCMHKWRDVLRPGWFLFGIKGTKHSKQCSVKPLSLTISLWMIWGSSCLLYVCHLRAQSRNPPFSQPLKWRTFHYSRQIWIHPSYFLEVQLSNWSSHILEGPLNVFAGLFLVFCPRIFQNWSWHVKRLSRLAELSTIFPENLFQSLPETASIV